MQMTTYIYTHITSHLDIFKLLIFRFVSVIVNNKVTFIFFFVFTFGFAFGFMFLEHVYNFLLYKVIISEDCFTLNITGGESSSQGSSQQNISGGGSSSNNPNPGHDPGPGPGFNTHPNY
jgi:hypothetical protein